MVFGRGARTVAVVAAAAMAASPAFGQPAPAAAPVDPPARVGRVSRIDGTVSFHLAGAEQWEAASINLPVTTGSAFWTEPGARADLSVEGDHLVMGQATELDATLLDDDTTAMALPQGELVLLEPPAAVPGAVSVQTPRAAVAFKGAGRYEVVAGDTAHPTLVTVIEGAADVSGPGVTLHVGAGQTATLTGGGAAPPAAPALQASLGPAVHDALLDAVLAEQQRPVPHQAVAPPTYVLSMTGGEALDYYGEWAASSEYGPVWYPPTPGFVPYRDGRWVFVAPWGWTWVADAPWGFAPSHYGRWAEIGGRWGWVPGQYELRARPVYAPALVGFLAGAALGATAAHSVGWVPLGPREPYVPSFRASHAYLLAVNRRAVPDVAAALAARERPGAHPVPLADIRAATVVPAAAMLESRAVSGAAHSLPRGAAPQRFEAGPPMAPTRATVGVTPAIARGMPAGGTSLRPRAPGPALHPGLPDVAGPPRNGLRGGGAAAAGVAVGAAAGAAGVAVLRPHEPALPALRPPGERDGLRPNGGAPGPALAPRGAIPVNGPENGREQRPGEPTRGAATLPHVEGPPASSRTPQPSHEPPRAETPRAPVPHATAPHPVAPRTAPTPQARPQPSRPQPSRPQPENRPPQMRAAPPRHVAPNHAPLQPRPAPPRAPPPRAQAPRPQAPHPQQPARGEGRREEHRP